MSEIIDVGQYLSAHHIRPSFQRCRIYQVLAGRKTHPTIDEIYQALLPEIPSLSKTTIYNTMELFIREQIVQPLSIEGNLLRYDADISSHGHFQCLECGKVYDFALTETEIPELRGFEVKNRNYFFKGVCPACCER